MARRVRVWLLSVACVLFFAWSLLNSPRPSENHLRLLADDVLLAACNSVRMAMLSLDLPDPQTRLGPKFEQLQASLDTLYGGPRSLEEDPLADTDVCASLAGKRITMIGGEHMYRLHLFLLQHRERAEKNPFPCLYHEFCTHHHICLPPGFQRARDQRRPSPRRVKPPTAQALVETESAAVNYIVSDTLFSAPNASSWEYHLPFVDPMTGVRLRETYWLQAARKANVVLLGRGPLSAPGQTYSGNWTFLHHIPDYLGQPRAHEGRLDDRTAPRSLDVLNAAVHLTVSRFLPDLCHLLQSVRQQVHPGRRKRMIWPSDWYHLPGRGTARTALLRPYLPSRLQATTKQTSPRHHRIQCSAERMLSAQLSAFIKADATDTAHREDPWTLLFNAQVYLQNTVLRELLPKHGIVFLPLNIPWLEGGRPRGHGRLYPDDANVDTERTGAIGQAFLAGLDYILGYLE